MLGVSTAFDRGAKAETGCSSCLVAPPSSGGTWVSGALASERFASGGALGFSSGFGLTLAVEPGVWSWPGVSGAAGGWVGGGGFGSSQVGNYRDRDSDMEQQAAEP